MEDRLVQTANPRAHFRLALLVLASVLIVSCATISPQSQNLHEYQRAGGQRGPFKAEEIACEKNIGFDRSRMFIYNMPPREGLAFIRDLLECMKGKGLRAVWTHQVLDATPWHMKVRWLPTRPDANVTRMYEMKRECDEKFGPKGRDAGLWSPHIYSPEDMMTTVFPGVLECMERNGFTFLWQ
jgi:hypothetical protein